MKISLWPLTVEQALRAIFAVGPIDPMKVAERRGYKRGRKDAELRFKNLLRKVRRASPAPPNASPRASLK